MNGSSTRPDYDLIAPISVPPDSRVPDPASGSSTPNEYDVYFRIVREFSGLLEWSRTCVRLQSVQIDDLDKTDLTSDEKCEILKGLLIIHRVTLARWVKASEMVLQKMEAP